MFEVRWLTPQNYQMIVTGKNLLQSTYSWERSAPPNNTPSIKKANMYILLDDCLYKKKFNLPYLRCLGSVEAQKTLKEIYMGVCGNHIGCRSPAYKALRQGYYWPTMKKDSQDFVKKCDNYQRFARIVCQPPKNLSPILAPWSFVQWGIDILGPFSLAVNHKKFVIIAVEYFTKWQEAETVATITQRNVEKFVWRISCAVSGFLIP